MTINLKVSTQTFANIELPFFFLNRTLKSQYKKKVKLLKDIKSRVFEI